jgi:hypothetical protein
MSPQGVIVCSFCYSLHESSLCDMCNLSVCSGWGGRARPPWRAPGHTVPTDITRMATGWSWCHVHSHTSGSGPSHGSGHCRAIHSSRRLEPLPQLRPHCGVSYRSIHHQGQCSWNWTVACGNVSALRWFRPVLVSGDSLHISCVFPSWNITLRLIPSKCYLKIQKTNWLILFGEIITDYWENHVTEMQSF